MKYIMFAFTYGGVQRLYPLIFPDTLVHAEVAKTHRLYRHGSRTNWVRPAPVSAGSIELIGKGWSCFGESESLGLKAHPEDGAVIEAHPYLNGIGYEPRKEG